MVRAESKKSPRIVEIGQNGCGAHLTRWHENEGNIDECQMWKGRYGILQPGFEVASPLPG